MLEKIITNPEMEPVLKYQILPLLKERTAKNLMKVNKYFNFLVRKELNKRVTIFIWQGDGISSQKGNNFIHSHISLGHAALKTYKGGSQDKGYYISLWPGNKCKLINTCELEISHFHSQHQDALIMRHEPENEIWLYNLNIDTINQHFPTLHDGNMNSNKAWSYQYNCSDVVLELLEKGRFYEISGTQPISTISDTIFSLIFSGFSILTVNMLGKIYWRGQKIFSLDDIFLPLFQNVRELCESLRFSIWRYVDSSHFKLMLQSQKSILYNPLIYCLKHLACFAKPTLYLEMNDPLEHYLNLKKRDLLFFRILISGLSMTSTAYSFSYFYSMSVFYKSLLPLNIKNELSKKNAINTVISCGGITIVSVLCNVLITSYKLTLYPILPINFISFSYLPLLNKLLHIFPSISFLMLLISPFISTVFPGLLSLFYDTTTTPRHIFKITESSIKKLKEIEVSKQCLKRPFTEKLLEYKLPIGVGIGGLLAVGGLFAVSKYKMLAPDIVPKNIVTTI